MLPRCVGDGVDGATGRMSGTEVFVCALDCNIDMARLALPTIYDWFSAFTTCRRGCESLSKTFTILPNTCLWFNKGTSSGIEFVSIVMYIAAVMRPHKLTIMHQHGPVVTLHVLNRLSVGMAVISS
jgi:hypothetical protein